MAKHKSASKIDDKKKKKGSQLIIRLDKDERKAFVALCETLDTSAAREIRGFMREFVAAHSRADPVQETSASESAETVTVEPPVAGPLDKAAPPAEMPEVEKRKRRK